MKLNKDGFRKDVKPFFKQHILSIPTNKRQTSPFIVITKNTIEKCDSVDRLLEFSRDTEILQTWPGKNRSDVFYFTVGILADYIKKGE